MVRWRHSLFLRVLGAVLVAGFVAVGVGIWSVSVLLERHEEASLVEHVLKTAEERARDIEHRRALALAHLRTVVITVQAGRFQDVSRAADTTAVALLAWEGDEEILEAAASPEALARLRRMLAGSPAEEREEVVCLQELGLRACSLVSLEGVLWAPRGWQLIIDERLELPGATAVREGHMVVANVPLGDGGLRVAAPLAPAMDAAMELSRRSAAWSAWALFPLLLLAWALARALALPVQRLARAVQETEEGVVPLPPLPADEIGKLGHAIEAMSLRLAEDVRGLRSAVRLGQRSQVDDGPTQVLEELREALEATGGPWVVVGEAEQDAVLQGLGTTVDELAQLREGDEASVRFGSRVVVPLYDGERDYGLLVSEENLDEHATRFAELMARTAVERMRNAALVRQAMVGEKLTVLGRMAASVAHEMNTPLAFVRANLLALRDELGDAGGQSIPDALLGVERLVRIVRDLSAISTGGSTKVSAERVELGELCRQTVRMARARRSRGEVQVHVSRQAWVECDRGRVEQVVLNLINNALDAIDDDGRVDVRVSSEGGEVSVAVFDDGSGVPEKVRDKLFEAFYTTKGHAGTGLGLYLSRSFIEAHDGSLEYRPREDRGSVFEIRMPQAAAIAFSSMPPARRPMSVAPDVLPKVLVIDDEPALVRAMLRWLGRRVNASGTSEPEEALHRLKTECFDLVLCDMHMPGMNGAQLVEQLRKTVPSMVDRVVIVTGDTTEPPSGLRVVRKPLDPQVLETLLAGGIA